MTDNSFSFFFCVSISFILLSFSKKCLSGMKHKKMCLPCNLTALSFIFAYCKCPAENAGNGISGTLNLNIFWGNTPETPNCLEHFLCSNFSSLAETFQISHFAHEIVSISSWQVSQLPLCEFTGFALVIYWSYLS